MGTYHPMYCKAAGVWKSDVLTYVRVGGVWRLCQEYVKVAGQWRPIPTLLAKDENVSDVFLPSAVATISYNSNSLIQVGTLSAGVADVGQWITPGEEAPGSYKIRCNVVSGGPVNGDATGSDLALTTSRSWYVTSTGGITAATVEILLKDASGVTLASSTVTLSATSV